MIEKGIGWLIILSVIVVLGIAGLILYEYMKEIIEAYFLT